MAKGDIPNTNSQAAQTSVGQKLQPTGTMPTWQRFANANVSYPGSIVSQGNNGPQSTVTSPFSNMRSPFSMMRQPQQIGSPQDATGGLNPSPGLLNSYFPTPNDPSQKQIPGNDMPPQMVQG